jgi:ATP-dependent DNA helicase DinG
MKPSELGLPPKFTAYRTGQYDAIVDLACSDKRFLLASIPTGGGKSPIYISVAQLLEARTLVLTANRALQEQLKQDFGAMRMEDIRGQSNYKCKALDRGGELELLGRPGQNCDEGPCHVGAACSLKNRGCLYFDQVRIASKAPLVVSNYAYWLTMGRWSFEEKIGEFDFLVCDEAHRIPDILAEFCAIRLDRFEVRLLLGMELPPIDEGTEIWMEWAQHALKECKLVYEATKGQFANPHNPDRRGTSNRLKRIKAIGRQLADLAKASSVWRRGEPGAPSVWMPGAQTDWVMQPTEHGVQFLPIWAHAYAEEYLFRAIPKILLTSATLQPAIARYLGIPKEKYEYREYDSTFDPNRRPIMWIPTTGVSAKITTGQRRILYNRMDAIIGARLDRKGIVMPRSYDRMDEVTDASRHTDIMISHGRRHTREAVLDYKMSDAPRVLVSPAIDEGFDFPDDECRYIIIIKVPFIDHRDTLMQARHRSDNKYMNYLVSQTLIQQAGRGWRSEKDWCEVFILDDNIMWFWAAGRKQNLWPGYFRKSYRKLSCESDAPSRKNPFQVPSPRTRSTRPISS